MNPRLCAVALALAMPALAEGDPRPAAPPAARSGGAVGVLVQGAALPQATLSRITEGLRGIARLAPAVTEAPALLPHACADDDCWAAAGTGQKVDRLAIASYTDGVLRLKVVDSASRKNVGEAQQPVANDPAEITATAEALLCRLLVPAGCTGEAAVEAAPGVELELDGRPLARGEKRTVAVGLHELTVKAGGRTGMRNLPVVHESVPPVHARLRDEPRLDPEPVRAAAPAAALAPTEPEPERTWTRTAAYVAAGTAVAALAAGAYFGLKSKSDLDQAESSFRANGGAYRASDLAALSSGNSGARTANAMFLTSGVLLATAAVFTFAF
jgi:hypothetical protein